MSNLDTACFSTSRSNGFSDDDRTPGEICIANISPYERRKRVNFAILQFIVTLAVLGVLIVLDIDPVWRLPLFFLFSASTTSFFQSLDKTWVSLAARGARKFGREEERIEDNAELRQVRRQAMRVILKGTLVALPLTVLGYFLPF